MISATTPIPRGADPGGAPAPVAPRAAESAAVFFRRLFDAHFSYVCRSLWRLGVPSADLEDVAQETFITIHRRLETFDPQRPERPWVFGFVIRTAANYRRKRRLDSDELSGELASAAPTPEQDAIAGQARSLALRALDRVPHDRREVLVMHELDGFAAPEIAEVLNVPLNTVYSRLRVARDEFERSLARLSEGGGGR